MQKAQSVEHRCQAQGLVHAKTQEVYLSPQGISGLPAAAAALQDVLGNAVGHKIGEQGRQDDEEPSVVERRV